jgi:predicted TIM-barrel fold metal-dependent hydrolase
VRPDRQECAAVAARLPDGGAAAAGARRRTPAPPPSGSTGSSLDRARAYLDQRLQDPALRAAVVSALRPAQPRPAPPGARRLLRPRAPLPADAPPPVATESFLEMFGDLIRDFSSWRINNVYALETLYPDVDLFVATTLDFDKWLYEDAKVPPAQQAQLMTMIAIASGGRVLPFVAFDPWRDLVTTGGALATVEQAITDGGAVGVKLYPPMGFRAAGNQQSFHDWQAGIDRDHLDSASFGQRLDGRLEALFTWCESHDVPIMAHTGASDFSRPSAKGDAEPRYWTAVLARHPNLRLDLSHLGGQEPESAAWRAQVMDLFRFPRVYGDVACFHPEADADGGFWPELQARIAQNDVVGQRLLYGSDWFLLSSCAVPEVYETTMRRTASDTLGEAVTRRLFGENAVDYLGLRRGQPARRRLDQFYERYRVAGAWRSVVDGPSVHRPEP